MSPLRLGSVVVFLLLASCLQGADIVVAAYNVENYLLMDRRVNGRTAPASPKPDRELAALVTVLSDIRPDVLGLCELGDESMLIDFQRRLKDAGIDLPFREWVRGADEARHLALLSRFPISARNSRDDVSFELNGRLERMPRGILDVTISVTPAYRLRLVGAHLKSRRKVPEVDETSLRSREAAALRSHLEDILARSPETNLLLFGDLNDTKNEYPIRHLIGPSGSPAHMRDAYLKDSRGETWTHFWKIADTYSRLDYFLFNAALAPEILWRKSGINDNPAWNEASDHRAIFVTISPQDQ